MVRIDTKRCRDALAPRREPYWYKLSRGRYLGLRKLANGHAAWIARYRDEDGAQQYQSLGEYSETSDFDQAKEAAEHWFSDLARGVSDRTAEGSPVTVTTACLGYVRTLLAHERLEAARDAHLRFRRTVYGVTVDDQIHWRRGSARPVIDAGLPAAPVVPKRKRRAPEAHAIASVSLAKLMRAHLQGWQADLIASGLSKASVNRTFASLIAALNRAVEDRRVSRAVAQEWAEIERCKEAGRRRELFLDLSQRRALRDQAVGPVRDLIEATMLTGCRAGELISARRAAFDVRPKSLTVTGKTGTRTIPLAPASIELFARLARDKLPAAYLLTRADGEPWSHSDWDEDVRAAAARAELPQGTCLYALRHSFITQALLDGMTTLEVARIVGTSLTMIEKHYGHLVNDTARERLAKVQMI
jgi:integrase